MILDRAASVRARLLNVAKATGADFNLVLVRFALERLLFRLSISAHADRFVLKGALLFTLWYDLPHRATRSGVGSRRGYPKGCRLRRRANHPEWQARQRTLRCP